MNINDEIRQVFEAAINDVWGNENHGPPSGYDEHKEDCECFNCELKIERGNHGE